MKTSQLLLVSPSIFSPKAPLPILVHQANGATSGGPWAPTRRWTHHFKAKELGCGKGNQPAVSPYKPQCRVGKFISRHDGGSSLSRNGITLGKPVTWSFEAVGKDGISEWLHLTYLEESRTEKTFRHFKSEVESKAQEGVPGVPHIKLVIERGVKDYRGRISLPEYKEGLSNYTLRFRGKNHEQVLSTKAQSKGKSNFSAEDQQAIKAIMGHIKRVGEDALPLPNKEETPEERPPEKTKGFFVRALSLLFPEKPQPQEQTVDPKIEHAERARAHILSFLRKFGKT